jgi:hypothetical protein
MLIEFLGQPILITPADRDIGFIHWIKEDEPVGLLLWNRSEKLLTVDSQSS